MATPRFLLFLLLASFTIQFALSATPPDSSPTPSPDSPADSLPSPASSPSPSTGSPFPPLSDSPVSSPPAPPPSDLSSPPPASPSPANSEVPSTAPAPSDSMSDVNHSDNAEAGTVVDEDDGSSGMNGGKKAGIAVGVISAAAVVGVGALVYKKRRDNIRRSEYGYAARRELL